jgi:tRNA pseudouridine55 synthase
VHKEPGWTSHDVVARVRRLAGQKRVGHAGTLDPLAEGVLPVPPLTHVASILRQFAGTIEQVPPLYSAIKLNGQRAYALARRGELPDLAPRQVTITELRLVESTEDCLVLEVACSKGTYVRALARDIAAALGTVGHLTRLVRTQVGPFRLADSLTLVDIADRGLDSALLRPEVALPDAAVYRADATEAARLCNGQALSAQLVSRTVRVHDPSGRLVCLGTADGQLLRPRIVL